jgi:hypothetical protein
MPAVRPLTPLCLLMLALAASARAETRGDREFQRWLPSLSIHTGLLAQDARAEAVAGPVLGPTAEGAADRIELRPRASGDNTLLGGLVGASLELMTPSLAPVFSEPRFFVHGGGTATFGAAKNLAHEGAAADLEPPPLSLNNPFFAAKDVLGQGTRTEVEPERWLVSAGGGLVLTFDVFGTRLRVKPSLEYFREEVRLEGSTLRAVGLTTPSGAGNAREARIYVADDVPPTTTGPRFSDPVNGIRQISLHAVKTKAYHGVGPGLEIEADVERFGPFMGSIFASGKATAFIGNLEFGTNAVNPFGESAAWTFEKERWAYRALVGLRIRWQPE